MFFFLSSVFLVLTPETSDVECINRGGKQQTKSLLLLWNRLVQPYLSYYPLLPLQRLPLLVANGTIHNCSSEIVGHWNPTPPHPTPAPPSRLPSLVINRKSLLSIHQKLYQTFFLCKKTLKFLGPAGGVGYFWNASSLCLITRVSVKPVTWKRFDSYEHTIHLHIKKLLEPGDGL